VSALAWICAAVAVLWIAEVVAFVVTYRRMRRASVA
jgi:hypothetical protein